MLETLEIGRFHLGGVLRPLGGHLQRVFRPQPVSDIGRAAHEFGVLVHEVLVDAAGLNDVIGDVVHDRQIGAGLEDERDVGEIHAAVSEGG